MIRFKINVMEELKKKGYTANRLRNGKESGSYFLSESTMQNIRTAWNNKDNISINTKALNTICAILKKQPGQILEYIPDAVTDPEQIQE